MIHLILLICHVMFFIWTLKLIFRPWLPTTFFVFNLTKMANFPLKNINVGNNVTSEWNHI